MGFNRFPQLDYVTFLLTQRCNLKCRLCTQYSPYYKTPHHSAPQRLREEADALFGFVGHVRRLTLSGGEILLRRDLPEFLGHLEQYGGQFTELRLYTNGSIVPNGEVLEALKRHGDKVYVVADNYGPALSRRLAETGAALSGAGIRCELRDYCENLHASGWVDLSTFDRKHDEDGSRLLYARCSIARDLICVEYIGGVLNICAFSRRCAELGVAYEPSEHVNLMDGDALRREKCQTLAAWRQKQSLSACAFCNGRCGDSVRYTPAEQL